MFTCYRCGKCFQKRQGYDRHVNRKNQCDETIDRNNSCDTDFKCKRCKTVFTVRSSLTRHLKNPPLSCEMMGEFKDIKKLISEKGIGNTTIINNQITNQTNQTVNNQQIIFSKPGQESIEHIINVPKKKF